MELRQGRQWRKQEIPELLEAPKLPRGAGWGVHIPPAVCRACLELLQGAEAEVRLLRQGRLPLLAAAQGSRAMLHGKRIHRSASCAGAEDTGGRTFSCHPRRGLRTTSATCPAHLPCWRRDLRTRCSPQFGLEPFSLQPLRSGAGAGSAGRGRAGRHSSAGPRGGGKTRPDSPARREPQSPARPPDVGGGHRHRPQATWAPPRREVAEGLGSPGALSLACYSSVDSDPAEAPEPAPPGCSSSSCSGPLPASFPNQLPNWRAGVGRSRLCSSPPLSQVSTPFLF